MLEIEWSKVGWAPQSFEIRSAESQSACWMFVAEMAPYWFLLFVGVEKNHLFLIQTALNLFIDRSLCKPLCQWVDPVWKKPVAHDVFRFTVASSLKMTLKEHGWIKHAILMSPKCWILNQWDGRERNYILIVAWRHDWSVHPRIRTVDSLKSILQRVFMCFRRIHVHFLNYIFKPFFGNNLLFAHELVAHRSTFEGSLLFFQRSCGNRRSLEICHILVSLLHSNNNNTEKNYSAV